MLFIGQIHCSSDHRVILTPCSDNVYGKVYGIGPNFLVWCSTAPLHSSPKFSPLSRADANENKMSYIGHIKVIKNG